MPHVAEEKRLVNLAKEKKLTQTKIQTVENRIKQVEEQLVALEKEKYQLLGEYRLTMRLEKEAAEIEGSKETEA